MEPDPPCTTSGNNLPPHLKQGSTELSFETADGATVLVGSTVYNIYGDHRTVNHDTHPRLVARQRYSTPIAAARARLEYLIKTRSEFDQRIETTKNLIAELAGEY